MDEGWDLHAVVRSCTASTTISAAAAAENTPTAMDLYDDGFYRLETPGNESKLVSYPNFGETLRNMSGGLEEVYKGGCAQPLPVTATAAATTTATSISFDGGGFVHEQPMMFSDSISFSIKSVDSQPNHTRKRKNKQKKRVVELREEELCNDGWAWRKYGQKPIKASPYPRNYYRCSTTKDCLARKQVERSPMDPSNFIVSYSGDHMHPRPTHLCSLAGSTRSTKFSTVATALPEQPPCSPSSPPSASSFSPTTSFKEDETEMNDEDIVMN